MRRVIAAIALFVVACAPPGGGKQVDLTSELPTTTAATSEVEWPSNFEWLTGAEPDGRAWLYFGPDESDNIHMHFECLLGSGEIAAEAFDPNGEGVQLALMSGDVRESFTANPVRDPDIFGDAVKSEARMSTASAVVAEFRRTGVLATGDPPISFRAANSAELARIQSFFEQCETN